MKKIYKYPLQVVNYQRIAMPEGARILTVQAQKGVACLWALVDPSNEPVEKGIWMIGTGHGIEDGLGNYIGTFQAHDGELVLHVFEE